MAFGSQIKILREAAKISVQKLADKIGVDAERWRKWEEKDLNPKDEDTALIEAFFEMDIDRIGELTSIKKFLNVPHGTIKKNEDLGKILGQFEERLIRIEANIEVLGKTLIEVKHKATGISVAKISLDLEKTTKEVSELRLSESRKKHK